MAELHQPDIFGDLNKPVADATGSSRRRSSKARKPAMKAPKPEALPLIADNITAFAPTSEDVSFLHTVFVQCFFPIRKLRGEKKTHQAKQGRASLAIQAGVLLNPQTGDLVEQDVPYGSAARLVMAHIQNHAKRAPTAEEAARIPMGESMRKFFTQYGKQVGGNQGKQIVRQVNNIAAMHMTIGWRGDDRAKQIHVPTIAEEITFWLEKDDRQRTFWQPEMILHHRLVKTIREHAMPYDMRAMLALYGSAREMDMLLWLSYRLPSIPPGKSVFVPFFGPNGLHNVFGATSKGNPRDWKSQFLKSLKEVWRFYPDARITEEEKGLRLYHSPPPISKDQSELANGRSLFFVDN